MENKNVSAISEEDLAEYWYSTRNKTFKKLLKVFRNSGLKKTDIAERIGRDPAQITRLLSGGENITLRTMSNLARAMDHRLDMGFVDLDTLNLSNEHFDSESPMPAARIWKNTEYEHNQSNSVGTVNSVATFEEIVISKAA